MHSHEVIYEQILPAMGLRTKGVIHEKKFNEDLCTKGCPWFTQGRKEKGFKKKFSLLLQPKMEGQGLYTRGLHTRELYTRGLYTRRYSILIN